MEEKITAWVVKNDGIHVYIGKCSHEVNYDWNIVSSAWD